MNLSKNQNNLLVYILWMAGSFALGNMKQAMFGDGTLTWAAFRFQWVMFLVGLIVACAGIWHSYYNQTAGEADAALPPLPNPGPDANGITRTLNGSPVASAPPKPVAGLSEAGKVVSVVLLCALLLQSCASPSPQAAKVITAAQTVQNNPGVQAAEEAAISIGGTVATGSPVFAYVAPMAVNGLTALVDGANPTAVTGVVANDAPLIQQTVAAAIPNSTGKQAAASIANAYVTAMAAPGVPQTPGAANAVLAAIASGLTKGAAQ